MERASAQFTSRCGGERSIRPHDSARLPLQRLAPKQHPITTQAARKQRPSNAVATPKQHPSSTQAVHMQHF
eukprot:8509936-Lingulodinium_polyedra.AAC.1